jgi:phospho-N-acetylmuramoyl-pentapeptide-transferase
VVTRYLLPLAEHFESFRAFQSITLRAICAGLTAFLVCFVVGPGVIQRLGQLRWRERLGTDCPKLDQLSAQAGKADVPTMGGMLFVLATVIGTLLFARLDQPFVVCALWTTVAMGVLGGVDDRVKLLGLPDPGNPGRTLRGMRARPKLVGQALIGAVAVAWLWHATHDVPRWTEFRVPGLPALDLSFAPLFLGVGVFVVVATANAVNLTDGLDGLAAGCGTIVALTMAVMAYLSGDAQMLARIGQPMVPGAGELAVFLCALAGGVCGFLWWNCHPARVFMGNTGSLALGGALGVSAVAVRQEVVLLVAGFVFVWEALSVILQVSWYRRTRRRVFLCAPFHHHLQFKGWPESRVVMSFWIGSAFLGVVALGLHKVL